MTIISFITIKFGRTAKGRFVTLIWHECLRYRVQYLGSQSIWNSTNNRTTWWIVFYCTCLWQGIRTIDLCCLCFSRYLFRSGNIETIGDKFYNTTVEVLPGKVSNLLVSLSAGSLSPGRSRCWFTSQVLLPWGTNYLCHTCGPVCVCVGTLPSHWRESSSAQGDLGVKLDWHGIAVVQIQRLHVAGETPTEQKGIVC